VKFIFNIKALKNKKKLLIIIILLILSLITAIIYTLNENKVAILGYHSVLPKVENTANDNLIVDLEKFDKQLDILEFLGYKTLTLEEFQCWKEKKCKKPHKSVLITFDDGYTNNYEYAFKSLKEHNMNAVVFVVGSYIGESVSMYMSKEMIENMTQNYENIEVASHSYNLHYHSDKTYEEVDNDITHMNNVVTSKYYAYPYGDYTSGYIKALKDNNYKLAFTFGPNKEHRKADIKDDNFKIPRLNISNDMPLYKFILRLNLPL